MNTLKLSKPIMINGVEVAEIPYDFENMTARDKLEAGKKMRNAGIPASTVEELDPDYHFYLFAQAVERTGTKAGESTIAVTDVMQICAKDAQKASAAARSFFYIDSDV